MAELHERVGDEARLRKLRIVFGMGIGDAAEILEGAQFVARHAVARRIHAAELPLRQRVALLGGVLQR